MYACTIKLHRREDNKSFYTNFTAKITHHNSFVKIWVAKRLELCAIIKIIIIMHLKIHQYHSWKLVNYLHHYKITQY